MGAVGTARVTTGAGQRAGQAPPSLVSGTSRGAASSCGAMTATDQGVTSTTITIGVVVVDMGAANNILALPSAADQRKAHQAVIDDLNKKGGVRCRKIVPKFYTDNPVDSSGEHAICLQMQQDKLFTVFNNLFTSTEQTCIAKARIPNIWYTPPHTGDVRKYAPYILSWQADFDRLIHQYVFGAKTLGFFTGMRKLGILEQSCFPDENVAIVKELRDAGLDPSEASVFNYGCSGAPSQPQSDQQAVLQFQREGVTHVLNVAYQYDANFSVAADQQNYSPKFARMEDASATALETASQKPGKSFDGTMLITTIETGAPHTPNYRYNQPTQACTKLLAAAGLPPAYSPGLMTLYGVACIDGALFKAAADAAPALMRSQLATGLAAAGRQELAYPAGPLSISDAALPTGGTLARPAVWKSSCDCWVVTDTRYRRF
jgi:hypothetical protein